MTDLFTVAVLTATALRQSKEAHLQSAEFCARVEQFSDLPVEFVVVLTIQQAHFFQLVGT